MLQVSRVGVAPGSSKTSFIVRHPMIVGFRLPHILSLHLSFVFSDTSCIRHQIPTWEAATAPAQALPNTDSLTLSKASSNQMALNSSDTMRPNLLALVQISSNLNTLVIQVRDSSKASKLRNNHSILDILSKTNSLPRTSSLSNNLFRRDRTLSNKLLRRRQVKPPLK